MSSLKPIKLYTHASGPNPWKVQIILEELNVPFDAEYMDMSKVKEKPYSDVNPNGRVPTIEDPNTGMKLWESGAIIEYLIAKYDKSQKLTHGTEGPEFWLEKQYLYLQVSGQGPYYGQLAWFKVYEPEKIPAAISRYENQMTRVVGVLDGILKGKEWLVGNKCTYADLSFVTWNNIVTVLGTHINVDDYPNYKAWHNRLLARPAVKKTLEVQAKAMAKH